MSYFFVTEMQVLFTCESKAEGVPEIVLKGTYFCLCCQHLILKGGEINEKNRIAIETTCWRALYAYC